MTPIAQLVRAGRDAVIAERLRGEAPARNPYRPTTRRGLFWQRGADQARAKIDELLRIG